MSTKSRSRKRPREVEQDLVEEDVDVALEVPPRTPLSAWAAPGDDFCSCSACTDKGNCLEQCVADGLRQYLKLLEKNRCWDPPLGEGKLTWEMLSKLTLELFSKCWDFNDPGGICKVCKDRLRIAGVVLKRIEYPFEWLSVSSGDSWIPLSKLEEAACYICPACAEKEFYEVITFPNRLVIFSPGYVILAMGSICNSYPPSRVISGSIKPRPRIVSLEQTVKDCRIKPPMTRALLKDLLMNTTPDFRARCLGQQVEDSKPAQDVTMEATLEAILTVPHPTYFIVSPPDPQEEADSIFLEVASSVLKRLCIKNLFPPSVSDECTSYFLNPAIALFMIGTSHSSLGIHADCRDACNFCVVVSDGEGKNPPPGANPQKVDWYLISPEKATKAVTWLEETLPLHDTMKNGPMLSADEKDTLKGKWQTLVTKLGQDIEGNPYAVHLEQASGEVVLVPPGWLHVVMNPGLCVKFATEAHRPEDLPLYVDHVHNTRHQWKSHRIQGPEIPDDIECFLCHCALHYAKHMHDSKGLSCLCDGK